VSGSAGLRDRTDSRGGQVHVVGVSRCISPVKACSVSSLIAVQKTGRAESEMPCTNSGGHV
jgi:hypothetical protein